MILLDFEFFFTPYIESIPSSFLPLPRRTLGLTRILLRNSSNDCLYFFSSGTGAIRSAAKARLAIPVTTASGATL